MNLFRKDPLQIIIFQSYGTDSHFFARGRALEDEIINLEQKSWWCLFVNSWKRFESDEIKHVELLLKLPNGKIFKVKSDDHGYFKISETVPNLKMLANKEGWLKFEIAYGVLKKKRKIQQENRFTGELLIPSETSDFGIVSDIDDTILHTGVNSILKWRVLFNTIFKSAQHRVPLHGAADLYYKLHRGNSGNKANPIFYVSHSPWNLYRYLEFFLNQNNFPKGPILLRSFKTILKRKSEGEKPQKQKEIINILKTYPKLKFILIGDSGEYDTDIYIEIAIEFPERILAIYLRRVKHEKKMQRVKQMLKDFKLTPVLLLDSSEQALNHARDCGYIK